MCQASFDPMENGPIHGFGFSIWLRMRDKSESMFDMEFTQELFEPLAIELSVVVYDDSSREAIMAYYRFSDKRLSLGFSDVGHRLGFDPFGEVIYRNKVEVPL